MIYIRNLIVIIILFFTTNTFSQRLTAINSPAEGFNPSYVAQADIFSSSDQGGQVYRLIIANRNELLGIPSFVASNIQVGDIIIGGNGGVYECVSTTFPSIDVHLLNDVNNLPEPFFGFPAAPTPPISIMRPDSITGMVSTYAFSGAGIDPRLVALINNFNKQQLSKTLSSSSGGSSAFDSNRPILRLPTVGTNVGGSTVQDFLEWQYFTPPTISLTLSPISLVEVGTSNAINLAVSTSNAGNSTLSNGVLQTTLPVVTSVSAFGATTSDNQNITYTPLQTPVNAYTEHSYSFRASQDWVKGSENGTATSPTRKIDAVYPVLYGVSATDLTGGAGDEYGILTHLVTLEGNKTVSMNGSGYIYYAIPSTWTDQNLSSIIDANGFNVTPSFASSVVSVTSSGLVNNWTVNYTIYKLNNLTNVTNANYTFNR